MNNEYCEFTALQPGTVSATFFETESCCDHVTLDGSRFSGNSGNPLTTTDVDAGDPVIWDTDFSVVRKGFEVCYMLGGGGSGDPHFKASSTPGSVCCPG